MLRKLRNFIEKHQNQRGSASEQHSGFGGNTISDESDGCIRSSEGSLQENEKGNERENSNEEISKTMKSLTPELLFKIVPSAKSSTIGIALLCEELNKTFALTRDPLLDFSTLNRRAAFIAQCAHESGYFRTLRENLNYSAAGLRSIFGKYFPTEELANQYARNPEKIANRVYANRMGNGPEASGDGWKFRGRGLIQLTGKFNYSACGTAIKKDLIKNPEYLETIAGALDSAVWFWNDKKLNVHADSGDITRMTRVINGGTHGLEDRLNLYNRALETLA